MYIARDYSNLVWKNLKLQHIIFNLSQYHTWKQSQQPSSSLGTYITELEGPTSSNHFSISP